MRNYLRPFKRIIPWIIRRYILLYTFIRWHLTVKQAFTLNVNSIYSIMKKCVNNYVTMPCSFNIWSNNKTNRFNFHLCGVWHVKNSKTNSNDEIGLLTNEMDKHKINTPFAYQKNILCLIKTNKYLYNRIRVFHIMFFFSLKKL